MERRLARRVSYGGTNDLRPFAESVKPQCALQRGRNMRQWFDAYNPAIGPDDSSHCKSMQSYVRTDVHRGAAAAQPGFQNRSDPRFKRFNTVPHNVAHKTCFGGWN